MLSPQERGVAKEKAQLGAELLAYTAFTWALLPDLPSKAGNLGCFVFIPYGGKDTVGKLTTASLVLSPSDGRLQGSHGNLLWSACRMQPPGYLVCPKPLIAEQ